MSAPPPIRVSRAARLYERLGVRYILLCVAVVLGTALTFTALSVAALIPVLHISERTFATLVSITGAGCIVATVATVAASPGLVRPVRQWLRGDRTEANATTVWFAATKGLQSAIWVGGLLFSVFVLPGEVYAARVTHLPWYGVLALFAAVEMTISGAALVDYFGVEALLRPVLRDVAKHMPDDFRLPSSKPRLQAKMLAASTVITAFTGMLVAGLTTESLGPVAKLGTAVGVAAGMSLSLALLLTRLLTRSVVSPIEQLVAASHRVQEGDLTARVPVTAPDELGTLGQSFNAMVRGLEEREALRSAMGMYVDSDVAKRILTEGELLQGREHIATVMFLDVRDFTALSERMSPEQTVAYLNDLFDVVVPIIDSHGGHVNKFMGDGLLAVFGVPESLPDHAARAMAAARDIVGGVAGTPGDGTRIGIGLHSGPLVAGTVGGGAHLEFALIGDTVNVAARVEQLTKETGDLILITEATRASAGDSGSLSRGEVHLRGKRVAVSVYALEPVPAPVDQ